MNIQDIIRDTYSLNLPIPVVEYDELQFFVEKGTIYNGEIKVTNQGEGYFLGYIESIKGIVITKDTIIEGNDCVICYSIRSSDLIVNTRYNDTIVITYTGGEIIIPIDIQVVDKVTSKALPVKKTVKKKVEDISYTLDKRAYNIEETGILTLYNSYDDYAGVKLRCKQENIRFNDERFQILDAKTIEFLIDISEHDKATHKVKLRTMPVVNLEAEIEIICNRRKVYKKIEIPVTEYKKLEASRVIYNEKAYKNLLGDLYKQYINIILFGDNKNSFQSILDSVAALINYDIGNVDLWLLYAFISILMANKDKAALVINQIDQYMIYYDKKNESVSQILFCLVAMLKGERCYRIVKEWQDDNDDNVVKLLVKEYVTADRYKAFDDYKRLYNIGISSSILYALAAHCLMHQYYYPKEHDNFYKSVLKWAINKDLMNRKWAKKIEQSSIMQMEYYNIDSHIAKNLYHKYPEKAFLKLLAKTYIHDEISDMDAYYTFLKCLKDKIYIKDLEYYYIKAAYENDQFIDFQYISLLFNPGQHIKNIANYFYINLVIEREAHRSLYNYHKGRLEALDLSSLPFSRLPESKAIKENLCQLIIENSLSKDAFGYYISGQLFDIDKESLINCALMVYKQDTKFGTYMLYDIFGRGIYNDTLLHTISSFYNGSLGELLHLYFCLEDKSAVPHCLIEKILYKGVMIRQYPHQVFNTYVGYLKRDHNEEIVRIVNEYYAAQILIEDFIPESDLILIFEDYIQENDNLSIEIALLKSYYITNIKNEIIIDSLIRNHREQGIVFSWYFSFINDIRLWNNERMMQYIEHYAKENNTVYLYYRLEWETTFRRVRMQHITLGMFIFKMVMFYNEAIQYYIEEIDEEGNRDILTSDIYICKEVIEQEDVDEVYDLINTALMSQELDDFNSFEEAIYRCVELEQEELESLQIL